MATSALTNCTGKDGERALMTALGRPLVMRLLQMLLVIWGSITLVFFMSRVLPADPAIVLSGPDATTEMIEANRQRLGLDQPLTEQYTTYLKRLARGDFGRSAITGSEVTYDLGARLPATLELVAVSLGLAVIASFGLAVLAARAPGGWIDRLASSAALANTEIGRAH